METVFVPIVLASVAFMFISIYLWFLLKKKTDDYNDMGEIYSTTSRNLSNYRHQVMELKLELLKAQAELRHLKNVLDDSGQGKPKEKTLGQQIKVIRGGEQWGAKERNAYFKSCSTGWGKNTTE